MLQKKINFILFIYFLSLITQSCSHLNEFGQRRVNFNLERIKPNKDIRAFDIIDTTKIYKQINIKNRIEDKELELEYEKHTNSNPSYLKFYGNGRVGEFKDIDLNNVKSFDPKKAHSNLFQFKNETLIVQDYFVNPQCGQCFVKQILIKKQNGQIEIVSGDFTYTYIPITIPKEFLIYKPDW